MRFNVKEIKELASQHQCEKEGNLFFRERQEGFFRKQEGLSEKKNFVSRFFATFANQTCAKPLGIVRKLHRTLRGRGVLRTCDCDFWEGGLKI